MIVRALIFHMSISGDQPGYQHFLPLTLSLAYYLKSAYQSFDISHEFYFDMTFLRVPPFIFLTL